MRCNASISHNPIRRSCPADRHMQVLQLFDETRHELLLQRISAMNLQPLPPVLNTTSSRWLGDRPGFY